MKPKPYSPPTATRSLNIELWHELGLAGNPLPVTITLAGESMRPLIRRGKDRVTIVPLNRPLIRGDIVLFKGKPERYVVHRVYKLDGDRVQTLGDNCYNHDAWMPLDCVWGLVVRAERFGRSWRLDSSLSRAWGRFWMAIHPARIVYMKCRGFAARCYRKVFPKK